ncbi:MAG: hypothetical protein ACYC35_14055 [Pirellulales bacterium]
MTLPPLGQYSRDIEPGRHESLPAGEGGRPATAPLGAGESVSEAMDTEPDARFEPPQQLAGAHYDEMMQSQEGAMGYLAAPDYRVRFAAILICASTWKSADDSRVVEACRQIAASSAEDSLRMGAVDVLTIALDGSKSPDISSFLGDLVMDSANGIEVRRSAYWALRQIQFGLADKDFDTFLKGTICLVKPVIRRYPDQFSEEEVKSHITPPRRFSADFWDSADAIDFEFVAQFASRQ